MPYRENLMPTTLPPVEDDLDDLLLVAIHDGQVVAPGEFSRGSDATLYTRDGVRTVGGLRQGHRAANGGPSVLLEAGRENLFPHSRQFSLWGATGGAAVEDNAAVAPDGTTAASRLSELPTLDADTGVNYAATVDALSTIRHSIYVKGEGADIGKTINIRLKRTPGGTTYVGTDLVVTLTDEWVRVDDGITLEADNTGALLFISAAGGAASTAASSCLVWGAQLEVAPFASSYIPTEGTSEARSSDNLTLARTYSWQDWTVYARFYEQGTSYSGNGTRVWEVSGAGLTLRTAVTSERYFGDYYDGGAWRNSIIPTGNTPQIGDLVELRLTFIGGDMQLHQSINGAAEVSAPLVAGAAPTGVVDKFAVGSSGASSHGFAAFTHLHVHKGAKEFDQLRRLV